MSVSSDPSSSTEVTLSDLISYSQPSAAIKLLKPTARALQSGQYLARFKGRGMEFDEVRPYAPGDDIRSLDWRVTARTGKVHTKLFREERERPIFLFVDQRAGMFFATRGVFKAVLAARLASLLAWSACRHGDRVGGVVLSGEGIEALPPDHGHSSVLRVLRRLAVARDRNAHSELKLSDGLKRLALHIKPGSLVFVISDFRDFDETSGATLGAMAAHSNIALIMVSDPIEQRLPFGRHFYGDGQRDVPVDADRSTLQEYSLRFERRLELIKSFARRHQMQLLRALTTDLPVDVLSRSSTRKGRMLGK